MGIKRKAPVAKATTRIVAGPPSGLTSSVRPIKPVEIKRLLDEVELKLFESVVEKLNDELRNKWKPGVNVTVPHDWIGDPDNTMARRVLATFGSFWTIKTTENEYIFSEKGEK